MHNRINEATLLEVGSALGRLVGAESALTTLDISDCKLGDAGLSPLVDALLGNTRLRRLVCGDNDATLALEARLASIRASTSLRIE